MTVNDDASCVLLYYKYVDISDERGQVAEWFREACQRLGLKGRIRVALDGVNVTVGGARRNVMQHIKEAQHHAKLGSGEEIDFKLSESNGALNKTCCLESGFDGLAIRECDELVSLNLQQHEGCAAEASAVSRYAATKLSAEDFHSAMNSKDDLVLIDTRNIYEHSIGHMSVEGVPTLRPPIRCFSDFPAWLDETLPTLAHKRVLMYCTGGVRCERASAYLRGKGSAFSDVQQLRGGIERYLTAFPDGGVFCGKNFVFDERVVHPNSLHTGKVVGECLRCGSPHDDYGPRHRCGRCRMLVLLCAACAPARAAPGSDCSAAAAARHSGEEPSGVCAADDGAAGARVAAGAAGGGDALLCELCMRRQAAAERRKLLDTGSQQDRKLRVLALHGFRENASRFRGRLRALLKRLHSDLDIDFVEAPHTLTLSAAEHAAEHAAAHAAGRLAAPRPPPEAPPHAAPAVEPLASEGAAAAAAARVAACGGEGAREPRRGDEGRGGGAAAPRLPPRSVSGAGSGCGGGGGASEADCGGVRCGSGAAVHEHSACAAAASLQVRPSGGSYSEAEPGSGRRSGECGDDACTGGGAAAGAAQAPQCAAREAHADVAGKRSKRAWFYDPAAEQTEPSGTLLGQLQRQTGGWKESLHTLRRASQRGEGYDGILAFSQGCSMALLLLAASELALSSARTPAADCSLMHAPAEALPPHPCPASGPPCDPPETAAATGTDTGTVMHDGAAAGTGVHGASMPRAGGEGHVSGDQGWSEACGSGAHACHAAADRGGGLDEELRQELSALLEPTPVSFKFALLFSGHKGVCPEAQRIIQAAAPLTTPSMHVYGAQGQDRQVPHEASVELAALFQEAKVVVHNKGHVVPSSKADCQAYLEFANAAMQGGR